MGLKLLLKKKQKTGIRGRQEENKDKKNLFFWNAFVMF
jgi:hypothetical protein